MSTSDTARFPPRSLLLSLGALIFAFAVALFHLAGFAFRNSLYSHILLIPIVSFYFIWDKQAAITSKQNGASSIGLLFLALGAIIIFGYGFMLGSGAAIEEQDSLAYLSLSFVSFIIGLFGVHLGNKALKSLIFPLCLLYFTAPLPLFVEQQINLFLQQASANAALIFFKLLGTPVFYENLVFKLPGIVLEVAPECSGIHSSLVLIITSLIAGHLFLRTPAKCAVLTLASFPLAILRNAMRIVTIGELCVREGPEMIDSKIHRHGGPLFFILSLLPLLSLLWWLWRNERSEFNTRAA